jgi:PAS domain S-box-containing protein
MLSQAHKQANAGSLALEKQTPDLYKAIFIHSAEAIAIIDPRGYYLEQNAAHQQLVGYSDEELRGHTPAIHMGRETFALVAQELREKGEFRGEITSYAKNGAVREIELSAFAMNDAAGAPVCYVGIKRDVTERKRAQEALRRSEAELSDFFETAPIGLHWVGPDGYIIRVNQAGLDLLGYSREEFVGCHISEFHIDEATSKDILTRLKKGEVLCDYDARLRAKDGSIRQVRINSSVYREDGKFVHTRCFTRDITDSKRTEQRLALQYAITRILSESTDFVESAHEILEAVCANLGWDIGAIWRVDWETLRLVFVDLWHTADVSTDDFESLSRNSQFEKGVGLPGRIWATGEPAWIPNVVEESNFPRASVAALVGLHGAFGFPILVGKEVIGVVEFFSREIQQPDEELLKLMSSVGGQIGQFQERKRAETELARLLLRERTARADAEQANRLKDEFLATVSHELRTPLNAIMGWSRMLRGGRLDAESSSHALEVIERNAWAQKQIIEDILDVSRVITGKLHLNLSPVDLVSVVEGALDAVRPALEAKAIRIKKEIDPHIRIVSGDADRLQQVVWNLLSNAAKFTSAGGQIEVDLRRNSNSIQIQVSDTGPGIDPNFLPYVFERFRQADGSTTRTHGGLGLGLAIVRHLVELHGGSIKAENRKEGSGAIFTFSLPLPSGELRIEDVPGAQPRLTDAPSESPDLTGIRVLVVDDETDALDLITMELAACGAKVTAFVSAAEALENLEGSEFDILISDIGMPNQDGYEFIRKVRAREAAAKAKKVPAVALTAYARVQDRMRALLAGYDTHVAKPIETNELVTVTASLVGRLTK